MANTGKPPLKLGNAKPLPSAKPMRKPLPSAKPMVRKPLPSGNNRNSNANTAKHGANLNNCAFGQGKVYSNAAPRKPKTYGNTAQQNGTKTLQYNNNDQHNAIRGFDIGNNAKYAAAQQMAKNTNALPSNFWEDGSEDDDTDSEEERIKSQDHVADQWAVQKTNIFNNPNMADTPSDTPEDTDNWNQPKITNVYNADTSSEDENDDDGFEKYVPPPKPQLATSVQNYKHKAEEKKKEDFWKNNNTTWIVDERHKRHHYDTMWFKVPKLRNGKANGMQMKSYLEESGLSKDQLKKIWKLSDLDKDGKMGAEEFALCMFLIDEVKSNRVRLPDTLPQNYIPPSFRGTQLIKTPPKKPKPQPKALPPTMKLGNNGPQQKPMIKPQYNIAPKVHSRSSGPAVTNTMQAQSSPFGGIKPAPSATNTVQGPSSFAAKPMQTKPSRVPTNTMHGQRSQPSRGATNTVQSHSSYRGNKASHAPSNTVRSQPSRGPTNTVRSQSPYGGNTMPRKAAPASRPPAKPMQNQASAFGGPNQNNVRNNPQRQNYPPRQQNNYQRNQGYPGGQYQELSYDEMKEKSVQAAKEAGQQAKKAGKAALGWMAKKMNDLNEKVQDNNQNNNAQRNQRPPQRGNANQNRYPR
eukprot:271202_1